MAQIIILTNAEQVKTEEYTDYTDIQKAVNGYFEIFDSRRRFDKKDGTSVDVDFYCNEDFLHIDSEEANTANAGAVLLSGQKIYGNVAVLIYAGGGEERGFEPDEAEEFTAWLNQFLNEKRDDCKEIHRRFDGLKNKPEPTIQLFGF